MVLHDHQANPHVHLSVRAESMHGKRLNPRKADLHRWRETFAERLREWGIDAEATRQATRGQSRGYQPLWRIKAREEGRERKPRVVSKQAATPGRAQALQAWQRIAEALSASTDLADRSLAAEIARFTAGAPAHREVEQHTRGPLHLFHGALASPPSAALSVSHGDRRMRGRRALRSSCAPRE